ncbi:MAG: flagellar brake domain-containing protein [Peptococcaceae bacterium]|nr:flagellar brake domain-containing protein [Peptococcaceae bacterium]
MPGKDIITLKQKIEVSLSEHDDEWYASSVQDIKKDEFYITIPIKETKNLLLFNNEVVDIYFIEGEARYHFTTKVIRKIKENIPMYVLKMPVEYERVQLREFFRVPLSIPVNYAVLTKNKEQWEFAQSYSLDFSAGGIRLFSKKGLSRGDRLVLEFTLPFKSTSEYFRVLGVVVRVWDAEDSKKNQVAVRFTSVNQGQVDKITRYLFSVMMKDRRLYL